ncbi:MAG: hypothetical protein WD960_00405 [Gemmatimonadota bacterium]
MAEAQEGVVTVRLLFVDQGVFHHEEIQVPAEAIERYERLIDLLREEEDVLRRTHIDLGRLCAAQVLDEGRRAED